jgi:hypothetical protein
VIETELRRLDGRLPDLSVAARAEVAQARPPRGREAAARPDWSA